MPRIGRLDPIHGECTDGVDAGQIHCVERLGNRERSCYAHSISFHAVKIGMEWEHSSFRRAQFGFFNSQRAAAKGECNADAIRKQLKTTN